MDSYGARLAVSAVAGGTASAITGGSFADGAVTAAYVTMFNHFAHHWRMNNLQRKAEKFFNELIQQEGGGNARYFDNRADAYDYMWENSFDANGNPIREVSGWELENGGVIVLPYDKNTLDYSEWSALKTGSLKQGGVGVQFEGKIYKVQTSTHTHPQSRYSPDGRLYAPRLSNADKIHINITGFKTINILYNKNLYQLGSEFRNNLGTWR